MNPKSLPDVLHQVNTSDENDQEGFAEITPDEAEELAGGTDCDFSCAPNQSCYPPPRGPK